ncbi:MAG: epoxide hydrolase family protein [Minwuia sp.]|uniref:epoxide hydrolase family protein n=1 Tax=Minwuia sp. TaxID=2493630 RepID=UPI003A8BD4A3
MKINATPFAIDVDQTVLDDLKARLERTRFPNEPEGGGWFYGADLTYVRKLVEYWRAGYDWRRWEAEINRWSGYMAHVDGFDIHFLCEPGSGSNPEPLLVTHGWPGSIFEFHWIIERLAHPERFGGDAEDGFTVICPSLPGYGWSSAPDKPMHPKLIADLWARFMTEVFGIEKFSAQGGDWGSIVTSWLAHRHPERLNAIHLNMVPLRPYLGDGAPPVSDDERKWIGAFKKRTARAMGYFQIQGTKPQTLNYGLADSPAGLAAWIVEKFQYRMKEGPGELSLHSMDELLTNIMIYWVNNAHNSASWIYTSVTHEGGMELGVRDDGTPDRIEVPTGFCLFPYDLVPIPPESWLHRAYNVKHFTAEADGGHFAALEKPEELAADIFKFFKGLR